jgi:excisionase family DNA binding protein
MDFVDFEAAKKRLGKNDAELQEMIKKGELRAFRDGGTWKFRQEDIDAKAGPKAGAKAPGEKDAAGDTLMSIDADILFAEEEEVPADSAAETWIAADTEGVFPAGAAAGSEQQRGVEEAMAAPEAQPAPLALSPETDESSLGAVLSEEELAESATGEPMLAVDESAMAGIVPSGSSATAPVAPSRTRIVTLIEPPAHHAQFTFVLGLAAVGLGLGVYTIMAFMSGLTSPAAVGMPSTLVWMGSEMNPLIIFVVAAVAVGIAVLVGYFLDKSRTAREATAGL